MCVAVPPPPLKRPSLENAYDRVARAHRLECAGLLDPPLVPVRCRSAPSVAAEPHPDRKVQPAQRQTDGTLVSTMCARMFTKRASPRPVQYSVLKVALELWQSRADHDLGHGATNEAWHTEARVHLEGIVQARACVAKRCDAILPDYRLDVAAS